MSASTEPTPTTPIPTSTEPSIAQPPKQKPLCAVCQKTRPAILRPKTQDKLCKECFILTFETEIHETIVENKLFQRGERVAVGASGGKDSTVLASVLKTLNERYDYGVEFVLLSIDEGIKGYRDDSLETVKRNAKQYGMKLLIVGYDEIYGGWTMDKVVGEIGKKGNCTYCGVFRRQALDRGAEALGIHHVVTGHNADDMAETVFMNLLRGDLPRLQRCTSITTASSGSPIKRTKPLKYAYEKEIVLYAHFKKLDYFTTECIYSPEAFRGSARTLIKQLEKIDPRTILNTIRSGEQFAKMIPASEAALPAEDLGETGCGSTRAGSGSMESNQLRANEEEVEEGMEIEIMIPKKKKKNKPNKGPSQPQGVKRMKEQVLGKCKKCGYLSSQEYCKACVLLEGLNKGKPAVEIEIEQIQKKLREKVLISGG